MNGDLIKDKNCPKCKGELYEGECSVLGGQPDESEPCAVCDNCEEGFDFDLIFDEEGN